MYQTWSDLTFLHWRYRPEEVRPLVPHHLELDTFDGSAWIGLTPFVLEGLRSPVMPPVPWLSNTPETNVRTYVRGPDGRAGIWFFSLDIARLPAVAFARAAYRLPYMWASMSVRRDGPLIVYESSRKVFRPPARHRIVIEPGEPFAQSEVGALDDFLTARWRLFTVLAGRPAVSAVEHQPWPLAHATVRELDQNLLQAAGLPAPSGEPLVHFSPGVDTRISAAHRVEASGRRSRR